MSGCRGVYLIEYVVWMILFLERHVKTKSNAWAAHAPLVTTRVVEFDSKILYSKIFDLFEHDDNVYLWDFGPKLKVLNLALPYSRAPLFKDNFSHYFHPQLT